MDKSLILNKIKKHFNFRYDKELADYLGIKTTTLAMWYSRNTYDIELLFNKCEFLNPEWLLTGKEPMLKSSLKDPLMDKAEKAIYNLRKEINSVISDPVETYNRKVRSVVADGLGIPMLPFDAFAGLGDTTVAGVNFDTIEERYIVPLFDGIKIDFMLSVRGSSMYPKYSSGDVVACRLVTERLFIQWNKVYVIDSVSQGVIMKRLLIGTKEDHIICRSDNVDYGDFKVPMKDIRSIALVVGVIRLE
jgi:phage repressor protein C with HTH and peptisase S24 domain